MNIMIDGYNLVKQIFQKDYIRERDRIWFHEKAAEYAQRKGHTLYIVYDGGPSQRVTQEKIGSVVIIYSGSRLSADEVIKRSLKNRTLKNLLLVTTDRELNACADRLGVPSLDSLDFYSFMKDSSLKGATFKKVPGKAKKLHPGEGSEELDVLMQEGSMRLHYKDQQNDEISHKPPRTLSKQEKRLRSLIKKL